MQTTNIINLSTVDEGRGVPLVFVHGFPLSRGVWQKQIDAFRSSHRVIAPDLPGFGESDARPGPTTMEQYADDVRALLQLLATGPAACPLATRLLGEGRGLEGPPRQIGSHVSRTAL